MKIISAILILSALSLYGQAQTNFIFTNDVPIGHTGISFGLASYSTMSTSTNDEEAFQRQNSVLFADERNCEVFHKVTTNQVAWAQLIRGATIQMEISTTNGFPVPKSDQGKAYFKEPKQPIEIRNANFYGVISEFRDLPLLDSLYTFPSNGEYVLQARYWYLDLDESKPKLVLSSPVRIKIVERSINSTNELNSTHRP